jgi:hypothetical protein
MKFWIAQKVRNFLNEKNYSFSRNIRLHGVSYLSSETNDCNYLFARNVGLEAFVVLLSHLFFLSFVYHHHELCMIIYICLLPMSY